MFYGFKVRLHLGMALPREHRSEWTYASRRALQGRRAPYRALLKRLKVQGLSAREAAVVAGLWLVDGIPPDPEGRPIATAICLASKDILDQLVREHGPGIREKLEAVTRAESRLGFDELDRAWKEANPHEAAAYRTCR